MNIAAGAASVAIVFFPGPHIVLQIVSDVRIALQVTMASIFQHRIATAAHFAPPCRAPLKPQHA
jgi:hypothetical protein